jgi:ubiquinone/menaquinone biosynthesis C-methylase UbiE
VNILELDSKLENEKKKEWVGDRYGKIAQSSTSSCGCGPDNSVSSYSCCGPENQVVEVPKAGEDVSLNLGYNIEDLADIPDGADLGLGCGNPTALASLVEGEIVLDLGSGAGIDCFIAAKKVGKTGKVIGVDMTAGMIQKARENAIKGHHDNVEFRLGEIEYLPVADSSVDVVISNCVINLVPDKTKVFKESFRVLKPGGRVMISDIVLLKELPKPLSESIEAYTGCISGAISKEKYLDIIRETGFSEIEIVKENTFPLEMYTDIPEMNELGDYDSDGAIASIGVRAIKH